MGGGEGVHPGAHGAHGDVDDVRVAVQLAGEGDAALHPVAAGLDLAAADAHLHGEAPAALFMDGVADGHGKAGPVLVGAAPAVRPGVEGGGEELLDEPAVGPVDGDHAEAAVLGEFGGVGKETDGLQDQVLVHHLHLLAPVFQGDGAVGRAGDADGVGGVAPVLELHGGHRAAGADGPGQAVQGMHVVGVLQVHVPAAPGAPGPVHAALADGDGGGPAQGLALVVGGADAAGHALHGHVQMARGGGEDAVAVDHIAHLQRREKMRIFQFRHDAPFRECRSFIVFYYTTGVSGGQSGFFRAGFFSSFFRSFTSRFSRMAITRMKAM